MKRVGGCHGNRHKRETWRRRLRADLAVLSLGRIDERSKATESAGRNRRDCVLNNLLRSGSNNRKVLEGNLAIRRREMKPENGEETRGKEAAKNGGSNKEWEKRDRGTGCLSRESVREFPTRARDDNLNSSTRRNNGKREGNHLSHVHGVVGLDLRWALRCVQAPSSAEANCFAGRYLSCHWRTEQRSGRAAGLIGHPGGRPVNHNEPAPEPVVVSVHR